MSATAKTVKKRSKAQARPISVSPEERRQMIEEAAYFRAEQRDFTGGDPVTDWLLSEQDVDEILSLRAN
jgi:hypothetical protein